MPNRQEFTRKTKAKVSERAQGKCEKCGLPLKGGRGDYDHKIPCSLGGDNSLSNCWLLGPCCHEPKTAQDIKQTRKADRQRDKATGAMKSKAKIQSRGFSKVQKTPKIDKSKLTPLPRRELYG